MSALCVWQLQNYKKLCHLKKIIKERYCIRLTIYVIYQNVMLFGETDSKQASKRRLKIKSMLIISAGAHYELEVVKFAVVLGLLLKGTEFQNSVYSSPRIKTRLTHSQWL